MSLFLMQMFNFLSCLGRTSRTTLNRSGESTHPCLVPEISGEAFSLSPLTTMLVIGFVYNVSCRFCVDALYQTEEVPFNS